MNDGVEALARVIVVEHDVCQGPAIKLTPRYHAVAELPRNVRKRRRARFNDLAREFIVIDH
jgi:hypothetical protein